jgi:1-acyl-sn-glycerol-3-phosphate acyltransferase
MTALIAVFYLLCVLFVFVRQGLLLRLHSLTHGKDIQPWIDVAQRRVARELFTLAKLLSSFRITVERFPEHLPRVLMVVTNHQSLADIPALIFAFRKHSIRFVTKRELGRGVPMVSQFLRRGRSALISRHGDFREGMRQMAKLAYASADGISPVVFPEGTRSRTGELGRFQSGAFRIILERAPLHILSVAIEGGHLISRLTWVLKNLGRTHYRVKSLALYPPPKSKREILELLKKVEEDIAGQLRLWRKGGKA